jgi:hypothetical protein
VTTSAKTRIARTRRRERVCIVEELLAHRAQFEDSIASTGADPRDALEAFDEIVRRIEAGR